MQNNRRSYFRLPIYMPIRFTPINLPLDFKQNPSLRKTMLIKWSNNIAYPKHTAFLKNLSGSGLSMTMETFLFKGTTIFLEIEIQNLPINLIGNIEWIKKKTFNKFIVGVKFTWIEKRDQDKIVEFIFKKQRQNIKID